MAWVDDPVNGFCDYENVEVAHAASGTLSGLTLAVKDIYAVKGYQNGWGSPSILADSSPAKSTAPAVQKLLSSCARWTEMKKIS